MSNANKPAISTSSLLNIPRELFSGAKNAPDFSNPLIFGIAVLACVIVAGMSLGYGFKGDFDLSHKKGSIAFKR